MSEFSVTYLARKSGAIGRHFDETRTVEAASARQAVDVCFDLLHDEGYETLHPLAVGDLRGEKLRQLMNA